MTPDGRGGDQPIWRRDFPFTTSGEEDITRREFTRYLVLASAAFAGGGGLVSLWSSLRTVETGEPAPIVPLDQVGVGESHLFEYPRAGDPAILVRLDDEELLAFSQKCTHLGCVVFWQAEEGYFECPCHEGFFDTDGVPFAGPPERPLQRILTEIRDGVVWATGAGVEGRA